MTETYVNKDTGKVIQMMSDNHPNPPENSFITPTNAVNGKDVWDFNNNVWIPAAPVKIRDVNKLIDSLISKGLITKEDVEK